MRLLIDEHLSPKLVEWAAHIGVFALSVPHVGLGGKPDARLWQFALEHDLTVVTTNARDFIELLDVEPHPGLVVDLPPENSATDSWKILIYPSWPGGGFSMKKSRFSEQQIAFVLRQAEEGTAVAEVCRKAGISEATYYNWRKKYGGLMPSEMKRLKQLEEENQRLKKLVADLSLDKEMLQDVIRRKI